MNYFFDNGKVVPGYVKKFIMGFIPSQIVIHRSELDKLFNTDRECNCTITIDERSIDERSISSDKHTGNIKRTRHINIHVKNVLLSDDVESCLYEMTIDVGMFNNTFDGKYQMIRRHLSSANTHRLYKDILTYKNGIPDGEYLQTFSTSERNISKIHLYNSGRLIR